ncbi:kinase-like domain-containing protein [Gymnopilus junonius]|uniref:Kinase-like domain-containing protein n=1 Tax=Gymnopilus junonius TaxID=109634 RepID=A0A9P5TRT8_GYMJU|nr:kinase-like domain-containing protein [Gymnopilus junonius]
MEDAAESPGSDAPVPFPRSVSTSGAGGEHGCTPSPRSSFGADSELRPRLLRGRFQSDVESMSSARARGRPESYDELGGVKPRSRFESMVNLGAASAATSSSDLVERDSVDGSVVRMRLVVREDGKPPTHFQLGNCIGRGQFGSVYRALNLNTGQMVAVKRIRLEGLKEEEVTQLMREVDLVKSLSHPSIVKYEGMARDDDTLSIVLEYAENGSLGQTLKSFGKLNEKLVASYVVKILEGLHYLHTSDVVHCDLKAANILTTKNGNVKLSDFGVSLNLRAMEREIKDVAGTPNWMAPEVIELKGASTKSDIWSLGCTVIELLTGRPPYAEIGNSMSVMFRIVEDEMPPLPEECSELLKDFLEQCFHKDPTKRPSAELLCEHPWLKNNWVALKELRPQDSIPFLRRVSTDLHKSDAVRILSQLEISDSQVSGSPKRDDFGYGKISPTGRRPSTSSLRPLDNEISPREHTFVKTTFSKRKFYFLFLLSMNLAN